MSVTELETIDDAQTTLRTDMAAGFRWLHKFGMSDIIGGSLVARVPRQLDWMLTHTYGRGFDEMRASDMVKVDHEANVIDNSGAFVNFAAVNPASWIFRARPDVHAVLHVHTLAAMAISGLECGLLMVSPPANLFYKRIAYLDENLHFEDNYCKAIVDAFGEEGRGVMYLNHSFVVVGHTVHEAILLSYFLNQACEVQLRMHASGEKMIQPSDEIVQSNYDSYYNNPHFITDGSLEWPYMLRQLDREDPTFRD